MPRGAGALHHREESLVFYELATLSVTRQGMDFAAPAVLDYVSQPDAQGKLLGVWRTVVGRLNQIVLLREFDSRPSLAAERERARRSSNPFHCNGLMTGLDMTSFVPFDFFAPVETGPMGPLYEIRTYNLRPAGLSPLEAHWRAEAGKGSGATNTVIAMYAMDGSPRVVEISPCVTFGEVYQPSGCGVRSPHPCSAERADQWMVPETVTSLLHSFDFSPLC
jgi:hypothetical protein